MGPQRPPEPLSSSAPRPSSRRPRTGQQAVPEAASRGVRAMYFRGPFHYPVGALENGDPARSDGRFTPPMPAPILEHPVENTRDEPCATVSPVWTAQRFSTVIVGRSRAVWTSVHNSRGNHDSSTAQRSLPTASRPTQQRLDSRLAATTLRTLHSFDLPLLLRRVLKRLEKRQTIHTSSRPLYPPQQA